MSSAIGFLNKHVVPPLNALSDNLYLSAIRAGMVAIVPLSCGLAMRVRSTLSPVASLPVTRI